MTDNQKNDLRLFLELFGGIDESSCEFTDVPDLIVRHNGKVVGVEHTRLYRGDPAIPSGRQLLPQEIIHWRIVERAREIFRMNSDHLLWLYVTFKEPFNYRQPDIEHEANVLAQSVLAVLSRFPASGTDHSVVRIHSLEVRRLGLPFPVGVDTYDYTIVRGPGMELWAPAYGYAVPELMVQQIETVIRKKGTHLECYRTRCDTIWLLVVTNAGPPSNHFEIPDILGHHLFTTMFDRLFLLSPFQRQLTELQVQHAE